LNVERDGLIGAIEKCWNSVNSERAQRYAGDHNVTDNAVAVVVQAMVDSDISGVMFTANPVTGKRDEFMIEAALGLGELLVQGEITPESLVLSRDGKVLQRSPSEQHERLVWRDGENQRDSVKPPQEIVSHVVLQRLLQTGAKIEEHYSAPQDIEWAVEDGKLYVVQSRPVTTIQFRLRKKAPEGQISP
jgi:pyruvate,water dikinase